MLQSRTVLCLFKQESTFLWEGNQNQKKHYPYDCQQISVLNRASGQQVGLCCMYEVICGFLKLQIVLVFAQHLVSYVPGKFLHQTTMTLYKDIKEIQQDKMVSTCKIIWFYQMG